MLLSSLHSRPLVCDGATGTQLQELGLPPGHCGELWNVEAPDKIHTVHKRYVDAGADLLTTNSFGGTQLALSRHGLGHLQRDINLSAARLARGIAGSSRFVLGDLGPCGELLEPYGELSVEALFEDLLVQSLALMEGGVDAILVETQSDPTEAVLATKAALKAGAPLVLVTYAFQKSPTGFRTLMGTDVATAMQSVVEAGAQVVGANCGVSLSLTDYALLLEDIVKAVPGVPVMLQPNAGAPVRCGESFLYQDSSAELAAAAPGLLKTGARILGGCCGTGPTHIRALREAFTLLGY